MNIIPSHLVRKHNTYYDSMENVTLRVGSVVAVYQPGSSSNINKRVNEYDVKVRHADSANSETSIIYPRCKVASLFGSQADYFRWTPRVSKDESASEVLVMCINGNTRSAYIVGSLPHPNADVDSDEHPNLKFLFNGVTCRINSAGDFRLFSNGPTKADGSAKTSDESSFEISMLRSGILRILAQPRLESAVKDNASWIEMTPKDLTMNIHSANDIVCDTNTKFVIDAPDGLRINPGDGLIDEFLIKGTTYRQQETLKNQILSKQLIILTAALTSASAAMVVGTGLNAVPIVGGALAIPPFTIVSTQLATAAAAATAMQLAIDTFEVTNYLSTKHRFGG